MPRLRDSSNDTWPRDRKPAGGDDYDLHSQGFGSRPIGPERGSPESEPDTPESSESM